MHNMTTNVEKQKITVLFTQATVREYKARELLFYYQQLFFSPTAAEMIIIIIIIMFFPRLFCSLGGIKLHALSLKYQQTYPSLQPRQQFNFNQSHHCYYTHHLRRQRWTFFPLFFCIHIFQPHNFPAPVNYWFVTMAREGGNSMTSIVYLLHFWSYKWFYEIFLILVIILYIYTKTRSNTRS